jgi:hypothetical protein
MPSYKIALRRENRSAKANSISLILLIEAAGFEPAIPCAPKAVVRSTLLKLVERGGNVSYKFICSDFLNGPKIAVNY